VNNENQQPEEPRLNRQDLIDKHAMTRYLAEADTSMVTFHEFALSIGVRLAETPNLKSQDQERPTKQVGSMPPPPPPPHSTPKKRRSGNWWQENENERVLGFIGPDDEFHAGSPA
jgi:hypothetical protein